MTRMAGGLVDIGDFADTGWLALDLNAGFTGNAEYRQIGNVVYLRGTITPNTDWGAAWENNLVATVAAWPSASLATVAASTNTTTDIRFRISISQSNGEINIRCTNAASTTSVYMNDIVYLTD